MKHILLWSVFLIVVLYLQFCQKASHICIFSPFEYLSVIHGLQKYILIFYIIIFCLFSPEVFCLVISNFVQCCSVKLFFTWAAFWKWFFSLVSSVASFRFLLPHLKFTLFSCAVFFSAVRHICYNILSTICTVQCWD